MDQLSKLQQLFQDSVLHDGEPLSTAWISAQGRADPAVQLSIYSYAYHARLTEVLSEDYPAMRTAIGDQEFEILVKDYINSYPSQYFSLRDFGQHMPEYLLALIEKDRAYSSNEWLYELSVFEWTLGQSFDAADATLLSENDLAKITPEQWPELTFNIHPSVKCIHLNWNVSEMWRGLTQDDPQEVEAERDTITCTWLFWRQDLITHFRSMELNESLAFKILFEGKTFNDICESLTAVIEPEQVPLCAASYLKTWISQGLICNLELQI